MKKINVKNDACIGCGACVAIDSEHFAFNDEGLSHPISQENLESEDLRNAIDSCPTSAIILEDSSEECCEEECDCNCESECECENCECTDEDNCGCKECHCEEE